MNVQQLGTGSINIGYFFLAAALISGVATLLSLIVKPVEHRLQHRRREIAFDLFGDLEVVQKREILRQSKLGKRLWTAIVGLDENAQYELERPGPKFRKAMKLSANNRWKKLTTSCWGSTTGQQADPERRIEDDAHSDYTTACAACQTLQGRKHHGDDGEKLEDSLA